MSVPSWLFPSPVRRWLAVGSLVVATGGLILFRAHAGTGMPRTVLRTSDNSSSSPFSGTGMHGVLALSHRAVLPAADQRLYAELRLAADQTGAAAARTPTSIAIVLDTSGSMQGEKLERAKAAVMEIVQRLRNDDEVALIRYSDTSEVLVERSPVHSSTRKVLSTRVAGLSAGGGTSISGGLRAGVSQVRRLSAGRAYRVVLVSDGLDHERGESERIAKEASAIGVTVSCLGIGLDFDEGYLSSVARGGRGNFGFAKPDQPEVLSRFLHAEVDEGAATTITEVAVDLKLPVGVRSVRVLGAEERPPRQEGEVHLAVGALSPGEDRRVVVELGADIYTDDAYALRGNASWTLVDGRRVQTPIQPVSLTATSDRGLVEAGIDGAVLANATSALASARQLEAIEAYAHGDEARAASITRQNMAELGANARYAPAPMASALNVQASEYAEAAQKFAITSPASESGKELAKASTVKDWSNAHQGGKGFSAASKAFSGKSKK